MRVGADRHPTGRERRYVRRPAVLLGLCAVLCGLSTIAAGCKPRAQGGTNEYRVQKVDIMVEPDSRREGISLAVGEKAEVIVMGYISGQVSRVENAVQWDVAPEGIVDLKITEDIDTHTALVGLAPGKACVQAELRGVKSNALDIAVTAAAPVGEPDQRVGATED
jgi:hypothetical protein